MMRGRLLALAERRARLVALAHAERGLLDAQLAPLGHASATAQSLLSAALRLLGEARNYPVLAIGGIALLAVLRPRRALAWILKGWSYWRLYRSARGWLQLFAAATAGAGSRPRLPR